MTETEYVVLTDAVRIIANGMNDKPSGEMQEAFLTVDAILYPEDYERLKERFHEPDNVEIRVDIDREAYLRLAVEARAQGLTFNEHLLEYLMKIDIR